MIIATEAIHPDMELSSTDTRMCKHLSAVGTLLPLESSSPIALIIHIVDASELDDNPVGETDFNKQTSHPSCIENLLEQELLKIESEYAEDT